ncbi:MAG: ATP synthase F1 subunit gamma [Bacillota bacterium]
MEELQDLRRRIRSIRSTKQITSAMSLVASTRLRRIETLLEHARPYATTLQHIAQDIAARTPPWAHPLLTPRQIQVPAYLVLTSDRGLAGGYNAEILRSAVERMGGPRGGLVAVVGKKGLDFFRRRGYRLLQEHVYLPDTPQEAIAERIARGLLSEYVAGRIDAVYLVYARFLSRASYKTGILQLLPIDAAARTGGDDLSIPYIYEPSPEVVLDRLLPFYLASTVYAALVEARASELAARTVAMNAATDNAEELIDRLTLDYNRARQAEITQEISEIVTGAESLR